MSAKPKRLVVLISGGGSNLQALINACQSPSHMAGELVAVISNRPDAYGLQRAQQAGIATFVIDHTTYADRASFDRDLQACIDAQQPDGLLLAGFMRILTPTFVEHYTGKMLNIHPSLLPAYKGTHTHQRVIADGGSAHGASVHFVTPELDGGPVILQARLPVLPDDTPELLAARVLEQEHYIYPEVVRWFSAGRLELQSNTVYLDGEALHKPHLFNA